MRLPNGIGSVHLINDGKQRRNPWRARVPSHVEFNAETGKATQKFINIGYYATETEAIEALFEYRKNPYTLEASVSTFADVYDAWSKKKYTDISKSAQYGYSNSYKHSASIHNMKMRDIRTIHLDGIMQNLNGGYELQSKLKTFWGQMFEYAMEHDIVQKDYSQFVKVRDKAPETTRDAISKEDIKTLWNKVDEGNEAAELVIIYIYTGLRATELLEVTKDNVDIENRIMVAGKKTDAGRDRRIPLHKAILPLIEKRMDQDGEYLVSRDKKGKRVAVPYYHLMENLWNPLMQELNMNYTAHYTRHTFATMMREADIAEDLRKLILGHKSDDVTDRYTHHPDSMLIQAIDQLPGRE